VLAPRLRKALAKYDVDVILDGEVLSWDDNKKQVINFGLNRAVTKLRIEYLKEIGALEDRDCNFSKKSGDTSNHMSHAMFMSWDNSATSKKAVDDLTDRPIMMATGAGGGAAAGGSAAKFSAAFGPDDEEAASFPGSRLWLTYTIFDICYLGGPDAKKVRARGAASGERSGRRRAQMEGRLAERAAASAKGMTASGAGCGERKRKENLSALARSTRAKGRRTYRRLPAPLESWCSPAPLGTPSHLHLSHTHPKVPDGDGLRGPLRRGRSVPGGGPLRRLHHAPGPEHAQAHPVQPHRGGAELHRDLLRGRHHVRRPVRARREVLQGGGAGGRQQAVRGRRQVRERAPRSNSDPLPARRHNLDRDSTKEEDEQLEKARAVAVDQFYTITVDNKGEEGLVVKELSSPYVFGTARSRTQAYWRKIKPDYGDVHAASDIDAVVIGAFFADGRSRRGMITSFLVGLADENAGVDGETK
jgi:hypothetical protein